MKPYTEEDYGDDYSDEEHDDEHYDEDFFESARWTGKPILFTDTRKVETIPGMDSQQFSYMVFRKNFKIKKDEMLANAELGDVKFIKNHLKRLQISGKSGSVWCPITLPLKGNYDPKSRGECGSFDRQSGW